LDSIVPRLTGLPAHTHLKTGEWKCYANISVFQHITTLTGACREQGSPGASLWISILGPATWKIQRFPKEVIWGEGRDAFEQEMLKYMPDTQQNRAEMAVFSGTLQRTFPSAANVQEETR
jgi:hypothetical protein